MLVYPGSLVHLHADTMAGPVTECRSKAARVDMVPGTQVNLLLLSDPLGQVKLRSLKLLPGFSPFSLATDLLLTPDQGWTHRSLNNSLASCPTAAQHGR